MKALRVGFALFLASGCVVAACANGESDVGSGYVGVGGGKGGTDAGFGGSSFGGSSFGGSSGQGFGGSSGQGFGGTGADGGTGGVITGGTGGVITGGTGGVITGGTGGVITGGTGGVITGGTGGVITGGTGGSTGGTGGIVTGGTGGVGGSTGGTGGTTNIIPTTCPQSHGLVGCCGSDNALYYWECAKLNKLPCPTGCGWNAAAGYYDCGFTGADPSGTNPKACGGTNPQPTQCPGVACCLPSCPTQAPAGCYCDALCSLAGDCCPDANSC